ncbi:MAG: dihydrofolate reductase family protein [Bacteroidota bacterium]
MLPYVILHMGVSVDGRIDWGLAPDSPYYDLVPLFNADTDLSGSVTMLTGLTEEDPAIAFAGIYEEWINKPFRPLLAVVDSRGQLKRWGTLKRQPWWRDHVALCSESTPKSHLAYLDEQQVQYIIAGEDRVDLRCALEELNARYGTRLVRVDSGGILNGVLLRAGLVDEVSVLINPSLVGGTSPRTMFVAPDLASEEGAIPLTLTHMEKIKDRFVWLRYQVNKV